MRKIHDQERGVRLELEGLELHAFSISGLATAIVVPTLDACFDLGHCSVRASLQRHVFLSHVHQDHALGVVKHLSLRAMTGARPSRVFVPEESRAPLIEALRAFERLEERPPQDLDAIVVGVRPGDEVPLGPRVVRAFDVTHRIASRGYTVIDRRRRLRPAYEGRTADEIRAARARGEVVADVEHLPWLTYVGDSTLDTLERHPEVGESAILILEATHLPGTDRAVSAKFGHTHLEELAELYRRAPAALASRHVLLKHFSMKYSREEILAAKAALPAELAARVTMLV